MVEKIEENKLCKYMLTFEAWVWSVVTSPLIIFKYVNWCALLSMFRVGWIPACAYIWLYCLMPLRVLDGEGFLIEGNSVPMALWCAVFFSICLIGVGSCMYILIENPPYKEYLKSKWLWK